MHQIIFLCRTLPLYFKKRLKENIIFTVYTNVHISTLNSPYVNPLSMKDMRPNSNPGPVHIYTHKDTFHLHDNRRKDRKD